MERNTGLNWERELQEQSDEDWRFGATSVPCIAEIPDEKREKYMPAGEIQRSEKDDMMDCASRAPLNILEAKLTYLYREGLLLPENKKFLDDNGYVVIRGGLAYIELSDAFVAINSGTTRDGNSLKAPLQAIHAQGIVPKKSLPLESWMRWEDYHDPKRITPELKRLGEESVVRFTFNYERTGNVEFEGLLKKEFLNVAGFAWPKPKNGVYPKDATRPNHAFILFKLPAYHAFDNYLDDGKKGDFVKRLASDYIFMDFGYRVYISSQQVPAASGKLSPGILVGMLRALVEAFLKALEAWAKLWDENVPVETPAPIPAPVPEPIPAPAPKPTKADVLLAAAKSWIGKDASPKNLAPQELACAEAVSNIIHSCFPSFPGDVVSTATLDGILRKSPLFKITTDIKPGSVIMSPTGKGDGRISNGHVGIVLEGGKIASNDSITKPVGRFRQNYTIDSWVARYRRDGGYPIYVYEPV